jgi:hypothetical protein
MSMKWIWICVALGLAVLGVVTWSQGVNAWTWVLAALLLVCPVLATWVMRGGLTPKDSTGRQDPQ